MTNALLGSRPAEILMVEDNEYDVLLTREVFKETKLRINLHHVETGEECMAFLRKQGCYAHAPTPDLILLDLNLPVMDGREVLAELSADDALRQLLVVLLVSNPQDQDLLQKHKLRHCPTITKPVDFPQLLRVIKTIHGCWLTVVMFPGEMPHAGAS